MGKGSGGEMIPVRTRDEIETTARGKRLRTEQDVQSSMFEVASQRE